MLYADYCKHHSKSCVKCLVPDPIMNDISQILASQQLLNVKVH